MTTKCQKNSYMESAPVFFFFSVLEDSREVTVEESRRGGFFFLVSFVLNSFSSLRLLRISRYGGGEIGFGLLEPKGTGDDAVI